MADFKILAVKILPGCSSRIRKVLYENKWYLFYKDYEVTQDGKWLKTKDVKSVPNDFYHVSDTSPNISISAIVGKNGDGKSSLIELIVRILNNVAYAAYRDINNTVMHVEGLRAELFFSIDDDVYSFRCEGYDIIFKQNASYQMLVNSTFRFDYAGV